MPMSTNLLGVHCSISGGVDKAFDEAGRLQLNCFQIFTKNQRQWREKQFTDDEVARFRKRWSDSPVEVVFSHASYLINLAESDPAKHRRAVEALAGELRRCAQLGLPFTVLHPGFARDGDRPAALRRIAEGLRTAFQLTDGLQAAVLLENMAGQGSSIGSDFSEIAEVMHRVGDEARLGFCFDTCHAFAAGHDIRTREGIERVLDAVDRTIGLDRMRAVHLNDSKGTLGSRLDRHWHIGEGQIGETPFRFLVNQFPRLPKVIETPKKDDWDRRNIARLRGMIAGR